MSLRDYMNNNSSVVTIVAVVVLVIALGIIVMTNKGPGGNYEVELYFYDLNTGKVFTESSTKRAPIPTESGPTKTGKDAGVMAYISSCGECANYDGMTQEEVKAAGGFITRLEMYTPEALAAMNAAQSGQVPDMNYDPMNSIIVKRPDDTQWVPIESMQGMRMMGDLGNLCPGSVPKTCLPNS